MKILRRTDYIFGMAHLNPQKSGLGSVIIWADHAGILREVSHRNVPRVKLSKGDLSVPISISSHPVLLAGNFKSRKHLKEFSEAIDYVARNHEIFNRHYNDTDFSFDDEALFDALRAKGEYQ